MEKQENVIDRIFANFIQFSISSSFQLKIVFFIFNLIFNFVLYAPCVLSYISPQNEK